jgi:ABC-type multidrug transport system fused ATPase/permease subunit
MKSFIAVLLLLITVSISGFAQKNTNAWKNEKTIEDQYEIFKQNVNFWSGSYFMKPQLLDEFHKSLTDSISALESAVSNHLNQISSLQNELKTNKTETAAIQKNLDESIKLQNSITVLGMNVNKSVYSFTMYAFILGVLVLAGIVFMLFKRSNAITVRTKKEYEELKKEFEIHKKNSLDRYTKMNMELHKTRMELQRK